MRALLDDAALVDDEDRSALRTVDRRWAIMKVVRPAIRRSSASRITASVLRVDRGGRLVEDQDRRVLEERARDADALPLAAGQLRAALAQLGVVARGQLADEVVRVRRLGGRDDLVHGRVEPAVADVVARSMPENSSGSWSTRLICVAQRLRA